MTYRTDADALFAPSAETEALPLRVAAPNADGGADAERLSRLGFKGEPGEAVVLRTPDGSVEAVVAGALAGTPHAALALGAAARLDVGTLRLEASGDCDASLAALGFALGGYDFARYRKAKPHARLVIPKEADDALVRRMARAVYLVRDLVNTPANDLGPEGIERACRAVAERSGANVSVTTGDDLLPRNGDRGFPMIHAVGRAAAEAPRLVDMTWGHEDAPRVTLVGKGVAFDTGGLNIKPGTAMALMKKDMGGAAHVLGLAEALMDADAPIRLRVLVPAVENSIAGNSFRPGDVLPSRLGPTVEIGNTDAEGRLILADALALGDEEEPALMIDMATLTGAARVALGPDLPPLFTPSDTFADAVTEAGARLADPVWRMPLWQPYDGKLKSDVADVSHISQGPFAGAVTAALFLARFVSRAGTWAHLDVFGWHPDTRPHGPKGGEAYAVRALYDVITAGRGWG